MYKKISRKSKIVMGIILCYGILGFQLLQGLPTLQGRPVDFIAYWTVSRLIPIGGNPYSLAQIFDLENQLGFSSTLLIPFWYPPWVIPFLLPFGVFEYQVSRFLWIILSIIILSLCAITLWRLYYGPPSQTSWAGISVLFLTPSIFSLMEGQVTSLILLGLVGFLFFENKERWFLAGLSAVLISIKPQLLFLFWPVFIAWILRERRWAVLAGFSIGCSVGTLIPMLFNNKIITEYLFSMLNNFPRFCGYMTIGSIVCQLTGYYSTWFTIIPIVFGLIWLVYYWVRSKENWSWRESTPWIILVSLITTPVAWMHDGLIIAIPTIIISINLITNNRLAFKYWVAIYMFLNIIAFLLLPSYRTEQYVFYWFPCFFLVVFYLYKNDSLLNNIKPSPAMKIP